VTVRPAELIDVDTIKSIAVETEMFGVDDTGFVDDTVVGILDGTLTDHRFVVHEAEDGVVVGAAYYAPEPFSDRMWNLYFIAVSPSQQGRGIGGALLAHVERELRHAGPDVAQVLIVETSSTDQYARTRQFYPKQGYAEEARIRRFYGPDDDKVVYWKLIAE
jgi:ribosomal protein S18 acetylase RimI-like enzyme